MTEKTRTVTLPELGPIYEAVGRGLTAFTGMQFALNMIFASLMEPASRARSVAAIEACRTFEARLRLVDSVAAVALAEPQLKRWRKFSDRIRKRTDFRNRLGHWMVGHFPGVDDFKKLDQLRPGLLPPVGSREHSLAVWDSNGAHPFKALEISHLEDHAKRCIALTTDLLHFGIEIQEMGPGDAGSAA